MRRAIDLDLRSTVVYVWISVSMIRKPGGWNILIVVVPLAVVLDQTTIFKGG